MSYRIILFLLLIIGVASCRQERSITNKTVENTDYLSLSKNILDYTGTPKNRADRDMLMFSDQGAWFAYSFQDSLFTHGGFSGPFLMTQENGVWSSPNLARLQLESSLGDGTVIDWQHDRVEQNGYSSHLQQSFRNETLHIDQKLVFVSAHTALLKTTITNESASELSIKYSISANLFNSGIRLSKENDHVKMESPKSEALGYLRLPNKANGTVILDSVSYKTDYQTLVLAPKGSEELLISQSFIFPEYSWAEEQRLLSKINFDSVLKERKRKKKEQLSALINTRKEQFKDPKYAGVLAKAQLTLQNNWRIAAGELKYQGLFPSYQYEWFHGFWSWDSWKHAAGLVHFDSELAKDQMRAMFYFQKEDGFIVDCVYRDTTIEAHNYRDTKPPLSAWAVAKIFEKGRDFDFVSEMYPKLKKYHHWWYAKRDHDKDGLCEYGSTDGTVLAAKWESGMDNAIRFDDSKILKNSKGAFSLDQESVDLNAYLFAEKRYLAILAKAINETEDAEAYTTEAEVLKKKIQNQFYDKDDKWFYDTNLAGTRFIKGAGSEGWTALWASAATLEQAKAVKNKMMDPEKFYTKVPFQTMSKDHPQFDPMNGYWRGPNWLDQAYFGVQGLRNYGYDQEADRATVKILKGAEGVLGKGRAIRENYHPLTGEGREAHNFSWSAAHIILLLVEEEGSPSLKTEE